MKTLLEQSIENAKIEKEKRKNIDVLTKKLNEAKQLHALIKSEDSFKDEQERKVVASEINRLKAFISSEEQAIINLNAPTDKEIEKITNLM